MPGHPSHRVATFLCPVATLVDVDGSRKSTFPGGKRKAKSKKEGEEKRRERKNGKREGEMRMAVATPKFL
uniref:Uncharacterized protein n=1 Tax=Romanomermis culicivorax TaxID=13658 RepID=A0A915JBI9_ROMCU